MGWIALGMAALVLAGALAWYVAATRVETPAYAVEIRDGDIELRRYSAMVVAEVTRSGDRDAAVRAAFGPLARYIFAKGRDGDKIAMTAPVTQTSGAEGWRVRFIMPAASSLGSLPPPGGDVRLEAAPAARVTAIRFSGRWSDANFGRAEARLAEWLAARGLAATGPPTYAYYNDPFTPWFLRRNEVIVPVESGSGAD